MFNKKISHATACTSIHIHMGNESKKFPQRFLGTDFLLQTQKHKYFVHTPHKKKVLTQYIAMSLKQTKHHNIYANIVSYFIVCFVLKTAVCIAAELVRNIDLSFAFFLYAKSLSRASSIFSNEPMTTQRKLDLWYTSELYHISGVRTGVQKVKLKMAEIEGAIRRQY